MKTKIFHTKIWNDGYFMDLTPTEKLLFIYYITNESINISFCYECPDKRVMFETGVNKEQLATAQQKFQKAGKIFFHNGWIYLKNADKYETYTGELNDKARERFLHTLSEDVLDWYLCSKAFSYTPPIPPSRGMYTPLKGTRDKSIEIRDKRIEKKGIVKGKHQDISFLEELPPEELEKFFSMYQATKPQIKQKAEDFLNYCKAHGKKYQDYRAALHQALARDFGKRPEKPVGIALSELISRSQTSN